MTLRVSLALAAMVGAFVAALHVFPHDVASAAQVRALDATLQELRAQVVGLHAQCASPKPARLQVASDAAARAPEPAPRAPLPSSTPAPAAAVPPDDPSATAATAAVAEDVETLLDDASADGRWDDARRFEFFALLAQTSDADRARLHAQVAQLVNAGVIVPVGDAAPF